MSRPFWQRPAVRAALVVAAAGLVAVTFRNADLARIRQLLTAAPALVLVPIAFLVAMSFDTLGWRRLLAAPATVGFVPLLGTRLSTEAVGMSLPSGAVVAEAVSLHLLGTRCGVSTAPAVASLAARRFYVFLSLGLVMATAAGVGYTTLRSISPGVIGHPGLQWLALAAAAVLLTLAFVLRAALLGGGLAQGLNRLLSRLPVPPLRAWLARSLDTFQAADRGMGAALAKPGRHPALTVSLFVMVWLTESCETFVILTLLGAGLTFRQVFSFDSPLTFLRALAFFVPAGLGVQDLGYLAFLKGLGVHEAVNVGAAFVLVKRSKEICWIVIGYLLLALHAWKNPNGSSPAAKPA
ncbi:MAG: flippase-like domain-containing protein [Acidobacteriota bacterium]|nr:flippase-like domain-containing protein [Acidobacteriota bacterium]